jgi:hypothetical protein
MSASRSKQFTRHFVGILILVAGLFAAQQSFAQATLATRSGSAYHATQTNCVILERMGVVGQVTSRMMSLGVRGNEFQFVEGKLPGDVSFHNKLTENDVRKLQAAGSDVVILDADYMPDSLMSAREGCLKAAIKNTVPAAQVEIASLPAGSDIEIDGKFVGSTPSLVRVPAGEHTVKLTKNGFDVWERTLTTMSSSVRISADLQPVASASASAPVAPSSEESAAALDTLANNR